MSDKKKQQLGMNPSTASYRLVKDILWNFIATTDSNICYHCSEPMDRETFSIEHIEPWLDSEDPVGLYFNLDNISFSHNSCNIRAARRGKGFTPEQAKESARASRRKSWTKEKRREYYLKSGK